MNKSKKIIIIIIIVFLFITTLITFYFGNRINENNSPNDNSNKPEINKTISLLTSENTWMSLQDVLNEYYSYISNNNDSKLFAMLDESFVLENDIMVNNVHNILNNSYESVSYIATKIYTNNDSYINYYFISGYLFNSSISETDYYYENNVSFIIIEKDNKYVIRPILNKVDIYNYASNYYIKDITINNSNKFNIKNFSEENKMSLYINEFLNIMFLDPERAYNMLDSKTLAKYRSYSDFYNQRLDIYNNISSRVFAYLIDEYDTYKVHNVIGNNKKKTIITEYSIMNYKIGY